jgi:hypothetical protein
MTRQIALAYTIRPLVLSLVPLLFIGCGSAHRSFDTAAMRDAGRDFGRVTVAKNGLSPEQIAAIKATRPPGGQPVDVALVFLQNGGGLESLEDTFSFAVVDGLKKSATFKRITPLPRFIVPAEPSFDALQELGIRSLSDYVLVFHVNGADLFKWTAVVESEWELQSSISFILVDSKTSALLTADKLFSTERYRGKLFESDELEKAQRKLFAEQAALLAKKLGGLFAAK